MNFKTKSISELFDRRIQGIRSLSGTMGTHRSPDALIIPVLRLAEEILQAYCGKEHYELSVWTSPATPEIVAYYDSARQERARTYVQRARDPAYYRQQGYEVIRLLDHPDTKPIVMTRLSALKYQYHGPKQVKNIKSTILYCFDQARPAAIVVTSTDPKAFMGDQREAALETIRCLSLSIRADLDLLETLPSSDRAIDTVPEFAFSWLHLSDIHFGAGAEDHVADRELVSAAILKDVKNFPCPSVQRIFITGDIAFKGAQSEYQAAEKWIRRLAKTVRVGVEHVRLVPGNHDVDRKITGKKWKEAAKVVRENPRALSSVIEKSRDAILDRVANYSGFITRLSRKHPKDKTGWVGDWVEEVSCGGGNQLLKLRIAGLSTVWVSDEADGGGSEAIEKFTPNMAIAMSQLTLLSEGATEPDLVFLLTHHPPEWLFQKCREDLARVLGEHEHVHLCGHIHKSEATHGWVFGKKKGAFRLSAGAAHDEDPKLNMHRGEHGYSWGALRPTSDGGWELGWAPRVYVPLLNSFRADRTRFDLDAAGFAWEKLKETP